MEVDPLTNHPAIKKANAASSGNIQEYVPTKQTVKNNEYCFIIRKSPELSDPLKEQIWTIFENNMKSIYQTGNVFPWDPPEKRKQMFHEHSRFLLIGSGYESGSESADSSVREEAVLAYCIFRFERDEERNVAYVYELQASDVARRLGLGRALIENLESIGRGFKMSLIMLTHLKGNEAARAFYDSLGFEVDETSPDYEGDYAVEGDISDEGYLILVFLACYRLEMYIGLNYSRVTCFQFKFIGIRNDYVIQNDGSPHLHDNCTNDQHTNYIPSMLTTSARRLPRLRCAIKQQRRNAGGAPHYNEPTGNLFGEKPLPPGQSRQKESWENLWYWGMFGSMGLAAVGLYYKPDTSIQSWALKEAKQRMEARGEKVEYKPSTSS
ncbi:hypothetical protein ACEPAF_3703 [Sanghuangporus sanghuang]